MTEIKETYSFDGDNFFPINAKILDVAIAASGRSKAKLSTLIGYKSGSAISNWETYRTLVPKKKLVKLCNILHITDPSILVETNPTPEMLAKLRSVRDQLSEIHKAPRKGQEKPQSNKELISQISNLSQKVDDLDSSIQGLQHLIVTKFDSQDKLIGNKIAVLLSSEKNLKNVIEGGQLDLDLYGRRKNGALR